MRSIRKVAPLALAGALALGVTSCAESDREGGTGDDGEGGGGTFTFGAAGAPEMFDPLYATDGETFRVTRQMFEGLLEIEPGGAEVV
ncbi:MAG: ABC transporter substrate-binding protein, partial [Nocardioides sp.]